MTFEYIIDNDKKKSLTDSEVANLPQKIGTDFENYNLRRQRNLDMAELLEDEIFFKNGRTKKSEKTTNKYEDWKTKVAMCKTYMFYQTLKAFIWKNVYANPSSMFDVSGESEESDNNSNKQKSMLVDKMTRMEYPQVCDKIIDYALIHGGIISFVAWKKKSEEYRKLITPMDMLNPKAIVAAAKGKKHFVDERLIYDDPYVHAVNPADFVFDAAQKDNWDECPKIYRSWVIPDDIINNTWYKIDEETAKAIRNEAENEVTSDNSQQDSSLRYKTTNGKTVEVLEHWGNYTLPNGTVLKNWHIVVVARKYLVRFEKNNRIINPFTYCSFITDPETGYGISPLYSVYNLAKLQEDLMSRTCDMQTLSENPPLYAPKGFFKEDEVKLYPGKIIEYGDELSPAAIKQMEFSVNVFLNDISYLSDMMAEVSGIFPNMAGADENKAKTATEISTKAQGQLTRLSMLIDTINQGLIVPDVKKIAKLCADFKTGKETIFVNKGNQQETIVIDDEIRQAQYRYTYSDRTATTERSNKADLVVTACQQFAQFVPLNAQELFTWYMEQKEVENPERFLQQQATIPQEVQNLLLQDPQIQQIVQNYEMQQENAQQPQPVANVDVPEAQPME